MPLQTILYALIAFLFFGCQQEDGQKQRGSSDASKNVSDTMEDDSNSSSKAKQKSPKKEPVEDEDDEDEDEDEDEKKKDEDEEEEDDDEDDVTAYLLIDGKKTTSLTLPGKDAKKSVKIEVKSSKSSQKFVIMSASYDRDQEVAVTAKVDMAKTATLDLSQRKLASAGKISLSVRNMTACEKEDDTDCDDAGESSDADSILTIDVKPKEGEKEAADKAKKEEALATGIAVIKIVGTIIAGGTQ